jgi:hypothetical protein
MCGRSFRPRTGTHRFCSPLCRERARALGPHETPRYGYAHQQKRRRLEPEIAAGRALCSRCGLLIAPWEAWDLDHMDGGGPADYLGASHAACNRATNKHQRQAAPVVRADDPANGVFWGPPDPDTGRQLRWSRKWFEWRSEDA